MRSPVCVGVCVSTFQVLNPLTDFHETQHKLHAAGGYSSLEHLIPYHQQTKYEHGGRRTCDVGQH
jgi:hypothetical protein